MKKGGDFSSLTYVYDKKSPPFFIICYPNGAIWVAAWLQLGCFIRRAGLSAVSFGKTLSWEADMAEYGETVLVNYAGTLDDGREFESTWRSGEPIEVKIGAGRLLPGVEKAIGEMLPGQRKRVVLTAEEAYGDYDEQLVQHLPASALPNADKLPVGNYIELSTRVGQLRAKVVSVDEHEIVLDCNHELAGHAVTFDIELVRVVHESAIHRELHPAGCACGCDKLKEQIG